MPSMTNIILHVLAKEWHEQRWKLAFGCVILMGFAAIGLRTRLIDDRSILLMAVAIGAFILPLFIGMGVVASDRAEGSLATLLALPIRPSLVLMVKLAVGLAASLAPLAGVGLVTWLIAGQREMAARDTLGLLALQATVGAMVLLWTVTLGVRQTTEARAALLGMTFLALGFAALIFAPMLSEMAIHNGQQGPPSFNWLQWACLIHPAALIWPPRVWNQDPAPLVRAGAGSGNRSWPSLCIVAIRRLNPATGGRR